MSDFFHYLQVVGWRWLGLVTGVFLVADEVAKKISPDWERWADAHWLPPQRRRFIETVVLVGAVLWAGYSAWSEEYAGRLKAEAAQQSAAWWASYWKGRATAPIQATAEQRPAGVVTVPKEQTYLVHSLETANPSVQWDGRTISDEHAGTASQITHFVLDKANMYLKNHGPDTLAWHVTHLTVSLNGKQVFQTRNGPRDILPPTDNVQANIEIPDKVPFAPGDNQYILSYSIEYDTIPATGVRTTGKSIKADIIWNATDPVNFHVPWPSQTVTVIGETEK